MLITGIFFVLSFAKFLSSNDNAKFFATNFFA